MDNPYLAYYKNQAGTGLAAYGGYKYQRGHGFFGSIFRNIIKPLGKYFGRRALNTGVSIGSDFLKGEDLKTSLKKRFKETGEKVLDDGYARAKKFAQTGKGKRRRRNRNPKILIMKKSKRRPKNKIKSVKKQKPKRKLRKRKKKSLFEDLL